MHGVLCDVRKRYWYWVPNLLNNQLYILLALECSANGVTQVAV